MADWTFCAVIDGYLNTSGVTIAQVTGNTGDGQPSWGSATDLKCRYESRRRRFQGPSGEEIISASRVFVLPSQAATINAKVAYGGNTYRVIQIDEEMGFNSLSHKVLWLAG